MPVIYSEKITARVSYIIDTIFRELLQTDYVLTDRPEEFLASHLPKISYGSKAVKDELFFAADNLLFEEGIFQKDLKKLKIGDLSVLFPVKSSESVFSFDPFAMAFYLLSRYEEYARVYAPDMHGRFKAENLIVNKLDIACRPVVNEIAFMIRDKIKEKYPETNFVDASYQFTPTYDIDMVFAHQGKSVVRTLGALTKLLLKLQPVELVNKLKTLSGIKADPFDNFDLLEGINQKYGLNAIYFVNLGDVSSYDKNVSWQNKDLQRILKRLSQHAEVGIHPSYYSDKHPGKIGIEKERLENIIGREVTKSRQHFLKVDMPDTYRNLIKYGITDDYSNGFHAQTGFRSGISSPHYFYDLEKEKKTALRIHPFGFMDTALSDYMKIDPARWADEIELLVSTTVKYRGSLMGIWHNYAIADDEERQKAYLEMIKLAGTASHDQVR